MATKNLSRTIIEGGRARYSKHERRASHRKERADLRSFRYYAEDDSDGLSTPMRMPVRKGFDDKLGAVYRWLRSHVGEPWDATYSKLRAQFDTRTTAGRHVIEDHILRSITMPGELDVLWSRQDFYVDEEGILRLGEKNRWNRRASYTKGVEEKDFYRWRDGRYVMVYRNALFWMEPERFEWAICARLSGRYWSYNGSACYKPHRKSTHLELVEHPEKLLAFEKRMLPNDIGPDGLVRYYREVPVKLCRQGRGNYFQGARLSADDLAMFLKLDDRQRDTALWVKQVETSRGRLIPDPGWHRTR